jgi:tetratricopeptide (TPR) repeat protein
MQRTVCRFLTLSALSLLATTPAVVAAGAPAAPASSSVKVYEEKITIPTYLLGEPDPNPQFYFGGQSQGAQHRIYPYPAYDNLTTEKQAKTYTMVYLENEYVKIGILPEIGGKVFEAIDKTNGYDFIYHQHVIKPALISLLGAWISGGIEWDIPHHHRATSFLPMQYKIESNPDGSKTVWVGELELRDRMEWTVGLTLHPGKSYLQASFRIANRTPVPASMLSFSNVAVHVNDSYQVIYPPSTQFVTYHFKRDFTTWPIATTKFMGADYTAGVDVSWYKNHSTASSMFAWNYTDDFMAGYDHGKNAGIMSIADHNVVPGKKFWTWGNGPSGLAEDHLLTDNDGPYIELMVGAYSDNQPDYSWLEPGETRQWNQYWYPFRDIDGVKNANLDAAVNLEVKANIATIGFFTTQARPAATVELKLTDQVLFEQKIAIGPGHPFTKQVTLPAGTDEHDLRASIAADGRELVAYTPITLEKKPLPADFVEPPPPADIKTNEELYLTGLRMEQFHSATGDPNLYWQEALRRDPGDIRVNTVLGIDAIKAGRYAEAEVYLRKALDRATASYTSPKDGEPFYYLGLTLKAEGKLDDAYTNLYKSTWSAAWRSPGYLAVAEIDSAKGDLTAALTHDEDALEANSASLRALSLKAALERHTGQHAEALATIAALQKIDPLDIQGIAEQWLATQSVASAATLQTTITEHPTAALEAAADYMDAGLYQDGSALLTHLVATAPDRSKVSPLAYYYLGYFANKMNQPAKAAEYYRLARTAPTDYGFPFQMEMIPVLNDAMRSDPTDARAPYYLGNLLFDWQPQQAQALWEKSASLGADFPVVYRNLALVYNRQGNQREQARAALEKAVQYGGNAEVLSDLDKIYEEDGVSPAKRLAVIQAHQSVVNRDEIIAREVNLDIFAGKPSAAIQLLKTRFFRAWEGGGSFSLGDSWVNANLALGRQHMAAKNYTAALADFKAALELPTSLQEASGNITPRHAEVAYCIGNAYAAMGDTAAARRSWTEAANPAPAAAPTGPMRRGNIGGLDPGVRVEQAAPFYQALAMEKLGQTDRATILFNQLIDAGSKTLSANPTSAPRTQLADAHYLVGLGQLGLNNRDQARQEFTLALEASPDHYASAMALHDITP